MIRQTQSLTIPADKLLSLSIEGYNTEVSFLSDTLKKIPLWRKLLNERQLKKLIDRLLIELQPYLPELNARKDSLTDTYSPALLEAKEILLEFIREIDERKLIFDQPFLSFFVRQGYMDVAEKFFLKAKKEDGQLADSEIFQAMRNIWIMNSLQLLWGVPLTLTPPMYAYSMLYPYTDNLLDDPDVQSDIKINFNKRLAKALTGEKVISTSSAETRIFELVDQILSEFPVDAYPGVTESIQLIHEAQIESMRQTAETVLTEEELLEISLLKGGTSVLADAYLIKGALDEDESVFAFHYGAFLQLLDDLQDKESDKNEHNQTLFTAEQSPSSMDQVLRKLVSYIFHVNSEDQSDDQIKIRMKEIISRCTLIMVMESVGRNPYAVTPSFYKELESYSKIRLKTYRTLQQMFEDYLN